tara:strand:- start:675 stop:965 length:291 start_codon:yes stop_codon:yes gene_type:complete
MIRFVEVTKKGSQYDPSIGMSKSIFGLREIFINPTMIVSMKDDVVLREKNSKDQIVNDLNINSQFTAITLNAGTSGKTITVVGSVQAVCERLGLSQ